MTTLDRYRGCLLGLAAGEVLSGEPARSESGGDRQRVVTGAVYGQIAGAFYGESGIPTEWREKLAMRELIEQRAAELHGLAFE